MRPNTFDKLLPKLQEIMTQLEENGSTEDVHNISDVIAAISRTKQA